MGVILRKSASGDLEAYCTETRKIVASGFDNEEDFEAWIDSTRSATDRQKQSSKPETSR